MGHPDVAVDQPEGDAGADGGRGQEPRRRGGELLGEFAEGRAGPGVQSDVRGQVRGRGELVGPVVLVSVYRCNCA